MIRELVQDIIYEMIIVITLMTSSGKLIKEETHGVSCSSWWEHNVEEKNFKTKKKGIPDTYHVYKGQVVIGYVCSDDIPQ